MCSYLHRARISIDPAFFYQNSKQHTDHFFFYFIFYHHFNFHHLCSQFSSMRTIGRYGESLWKKRLHVWDYEIREYAICRSNSYSFGRWASDLFPLPHATAFAKKLAMSELWSTRIVMALPFMFMHRRVVDSQNKLHAGTEFDPRRWLVKNWK